ncbi:phosphonate ABC transporter, permease protein PhnE [Microbacterium sp.]|uniref:phosphonate ABC transporter, permease protein PhnE n=1 Tax=Microbacterium sp. TaxID=51671 RepID=UPI003C796D17
MTAAVEFAPRRPTPPSRLGRTLWELAALGVFALCVSGLDADWETLAQAPASAWEYTQLMVRGILNNPFAQPYSEYWLTAIEYMMASLAMAWIGTAIAAVLSLPVGLLAARNVSPAWVVFPVRQVLNAIRAVPDLIFAIVIMIPVFGLGPLAGALALGLGSIGTIGKLTAEAIEGVPPATIDAVRATGARQVQVLRWGVIPQVAPEIASFWLYRFEVNIRAGAILGAVGAGGIGSLLSQLFRLRDWDRIGIALFTIIAITMIVDAISGAVRHRIIGNEEPPGRRRRPR